MKTPPLSSRTRTLGTENAFVVLAEVDALAAQGKNVISFCIGQPDFPSPRHVQQAGIEAIESGKHGYTPSAGIAPLRAAAAAYLSKLRGVPINDTDVVVSAGAKPFIAYAILSTTDCGCGDEVIYPVPGFPIYESQIRALGAVPIPLYLRQSRGFAFDPNELADKITARTRVVILNSPHNPTGGVLSAADLSDIADVLRRHPQVWIFADEIYSRLVFDGTFRSIASEPEMLHRTIICEGASKTWAMTGWRIGFAANKTLAPVLTNWVTNTVSCASQISQWAALAAITGPQDEADQMREEFLRRRDLIVQRLNQIPGMDCQRSGGALYAWPNVTQACEMTGCTDAEEFRKRLLYEANVAVLADIHFGHRVPDDGQHVRFSFATSMENIERGVDRIAQFVAGAGRAGRG